MQTTPEVRIEEVSSILTPAEGVTLDQAIADAKLAGFENIECAEDGSHAIITWYKRAEN
jgi:hypothetical protein